LEQRGPRGLFEGYHRLYGRPVCHFVIKQCYQLMQSKKWVRNGVLL
jgi:hypothetical protein